MKKIYLTIIIFMFLSTQAFAIDFSNLSLSGFISQGYMYTSENNFFGPTQSDGTFKLDEYGLLFGARVTKRLQASVQLLAYTIGETLGNNSLNIDFAYLRYDFSPYFGIQAGQMKAPHGFWNQSRDLDNAWMCIFFPTGTYTDRARDAMLRCRGLGLYGRVPMDFMGELVLEYLVGEPDLDETSGTVRGWEALAPWANTISKVNVDIEHNFHVEWETPLSGLTLGGTLRLSDLTYVDHFTNSDDYVNLPPFYDPVKGANVHMEGIKVYKVGAKYELYNLMVAAEYYNVSLDRTMFMRTEGLESEAWYAMIQYQVLDQLGFGIYYDEYYPDVDDRSGRTLPADRHTNWSKDTCVYARYDINENWIVKLESHLFDGTALLLRPLNMDENGNSTLSRKWYMFVLKASVTF